MAIDKRILIPGWAGELEPDELKFVKKELKRKKKKSALAI